MEEKKKTPAKAETKKTKEVKPKTTKATKATSTAKTSKAKTSTKTTKKATTKKEPVKKEVAKKESVKKEVEKQESVETKVIPQEVVKQELIQEQAKQEMPKQEEAKPKFQKVEQPKPKKGKKKIVVFFLLVVIIAGFAAAWMYVPEFRNLFSFMNTNNTASQSDDDKVNNAKEWEKAYIKVLSDENNYKNVSNCKIQLITVNEGDEIPVLLVNYTNYNKNVLDIWQSNENGEIINKKDNNTVSGDVIKVLYNVKDELYDWYLYDKDAETQTYKKISGLLAPQINSYVKLKSTDYIISSKENVGNITKEKFDQEVIVVDSRYINKSWVEYKENSSQSDILKILESEYKKKRTAREVVTDYAKEEILDKAEEINKKQNVEPTVVEENKTTIDENKTAVEENKIENTTVTEQPTVTENKTDIGKDEALKLLEKQFGTSSDGKKMGYYYLAWVKDDKDNKYYAFQMSWLVDNHYSFVDTVLVSADGKTYKEISTPENFTDGQTVTKFDSEKSF